MADEEQTDLNGKEVHAFAWKMANVGYQRMTDLLMAMFRSGRWRQYRDGQGKYKFLPGEFDYFLTQRGIRRDDVMKISDWDAKAELESAMDERRTGEEGYRAGWPVDRPDPGDPVLLARLRNRRGRARLASPSGRTMAAHP